jgi:hypothetical protein
MNEAVVAALARAVGLPVPDERLQEAAASLEAQITAGGGSSPDELEGVEPAVVFDPGWKE